MVHRRLTACVMGGLVCRQPAADAPQRLADRPTEQGRKFILERRRSDIEAAKAKRPGYHRGAERVPDERVAGTEPGGAPGLKTAIEQLVCLYEFCQFSIGGCRKVAQLLQKARAVTATAH
jgi:hypothetical protein